MALKNSRIQKAGLKAWGVPCAAGLLCAVLLGFSSHGAAQQPGDVSLNANQQLFTVLAALNAAGYDSGLGAGAANAVRQQVREKLARENIAVLPELQKFYQAHLMQGDPGQNLGQYVSLALLLGPPPDFMPTVSQSDLPPDAKKLVGMIPLLKRFYSEANLGAIWSSVQPALQAEIERYSPPVRNAIELTDAYLRFPSGTYLGRKYSIDLDLLASPEQTQARIYGSNYFLVVTPSSNVKVQAIRHQYLHFLLDPLAAKYADVIEQKSQLRTLARGAPALSPDFKDDFPLLVTECLIRAIEVRLEKPAPTAAELKVKALANSGLILTPYFYDSLVAYEKQESSMSVYYKDMVQGIDVGKEQARLSKVIFTAPPPPVKAEAAPAKSELDRLLDQGDNAVYKGHYDEAKTAFQTVIKRIDPKNDRALFGLAVVASNTSKPDTAEGYFHKVLAESSDVRLVTWSHIYIGRIEDLKGNRKEALEQYRAASVTAGRYPEAYRAAQSGLAHPFGSQE